MYDCMDTCMYSSLCDDKSYKKIFLYTLFFFYLSFLYHIKIFFKKYLMYK